MSASFTRRAAIGALVAAPLSATTCAQSAAAQPQGLSPAFARALAHLRTAREETRDFADRLYLPAYEAARAEILALPHEAVGPDAYSGRVDTVTTADIAEVARARQLVREVTEGRTRLETEKFRSLAAHWDFAQRLAAAADRRVAAILSIEVRHRVPELEERSDELDEIYLAALNAMVATPAVTLTDLLAKIEAITDEKETEAEASWAALRADAARLAGMAQ